MPVMRNSVLFDRHFPPPKILFVYLIEKERAHAGEARDREVGFPLSRELVWGWITRTLGS